tara:strand:- start:310 stop:636 length:327 start_codon:yes stop_codon:yes gene_type:complete
MTVSAGQLDQRVAIQTEARVSDGVGGYEVTWSTTATVWAMVKPVRGREQMEAQQLQASAMYRITIRNRAVSAAQRIVWRGLTLNIREAPDPGGRAMYREILAEEGVAV